MGETDPGDAGEGEGAAACCGKVKKDIIAHRLRNNHIELLNERVSKLKVLFGFFQ